MIFRANRATSKAIIETPPLLIRDGGVIAEGYNAELDEWRTPFSWCNTIFRKFRTTRTGKYRY